MRPLYFLLRITLPYAFFVYFRRRGAMNSQRKFNAQTIFVCNHPSAFFDPLTAANHQWPIMYFMTRSDVFKPWLKPVTWASQMVPIYRQNEDGADSFEKNKQVFRGIQKVLKRKKSLILFGEGYTDNEFIRSLKPMKKGAARIGFGTMDASDWKLNIKVQAIGINYSDPNVLRSDCLLSLGKLIYLQDYKELYQENPNKAITQLTREIGEDLQKNLTYIENKSLAPFLEELLILSRKGMNHIHHDHTYSLRERFEYSRALATRINEEYSEDDSNWHDLKQVSDDYFKELKQHKLQDFVLYNYASHGEKKSTFLSWMYLILASPVLIFGILHSAVPYYLVKTLIEKIFKRKVFWSGVKMLLGGLAWLLFNLPFIWIFYDYIYPSYLLATTYFLFAIPLTFVLSHNWLTKLRRTLMINKADVSVLQKLNQKRKLVLEKMKAMSI